MQSLYPLLHPFYEKLDFREVILKRVQYKLFCDVQNRTWTPIQLRINNNFWVSIQMAQLQSEIHEYNFRYSSKSWNAGAPS